MMYTIAILAASAAIANAQFTTGPSGVITCTGNPNGDYCAGDSLSTPIIIRCSNGVGQPGNCNDNLAGYFPFGDTGTASCYQSSTTSGDAACAKNCIVEGSSGNFNGTLTLPGCTPSSPSTSSTPTSTSTSTSVSTTGVSTTTVTSSSSTTTSTGISTIVSGSTTEIITFTTTYCPQSTFSTSIIPPPISTGTGSATYTTSSNGTITSAPGGGAGGSTSSSATATPIGPTTTSSPSGATPFTGAGVLNNAPAGLAAIGLMAAYFL